MWELDYKESWVPKNWCFWTMVLERTLESPLDCKEIQPAHPKELSPECSLEGLMLKLKLQSFGHLMQRTDSLQKTLILGKMEGRRRRDWQTMRWLDGITNSMDMSLSKLRSWWYQGSLACCGPWGHRESDTTEGLNWSQFLSAVYGRGLLFLLTYTDALECWGSTQWILVEWMNKYIKFTFGPSVLVLWQHLAWYF